MAKSGPVKHPRVHGAMVTYKDGCRCLLCVQKMREYKGAVYHRRPDAWRTDYYRRKYGITLEDYAEMFDRQKGLCAICSHEICGKNSHFDVDHCHVSGEVRGLLCRSCNGKLGWYERFQSVVEIYLERN